MFEHFKGDEAFLKKILDYQTQALNHQRIVLTSFLNPHEQSLVYKVIPQGELQICSYGGLTHAENQRMIICPDFYQIEYDDFQIVIVEIIYNQQFGKVMHKDILGALMNLGIKRECIGDIYLSDRIFFTCTEQTFAYISQNLNQIKKAKVHLKRVNEQIEIARQYTTKTFFISSYRLDKVISSFYNVSRQQASEAIRAGFVKVNYKIIEEVNFLCHNNDVISFKHHGRVKFVDENRTTKQSNHVVTGYFYK